MSTQNNTYSAADLARYHAGSMTNAEMHALEKAALEDPFLADALEGYAFTTAPVSDIAEIKQRLTPQRESAKIFSFSRPAGNGWWRVAAILIVFAGAGYIFYRVNSSRETPLAQNKTKQAPSINSEPPVDNTSPVISPAKVDTQKFAAAVTSAEPGRNKSSLKQQRLAIKSNGTAAYSTIEPAPAMDSIGIPAAPQNKYEENANRDYLVQGNVTDEKGAPVQGAFVNVSGSNAVRTDQNGQFQLNTNNAVADASVSSNGYSSKNVQLNSAAENNIALDKEREYYSSKTKKANANSVKDNNERMRKALAEKENVRQMEPGRMEPVDSVVFIDYLEKNLREVKDPKGRPYEGKVILSFDVNKKGQPENIKVDSSLCKTCDEQAVQLLKKGPKWLLPAAKTKKRVAVEYSESPEE